MALPDPSGAAMKEYEPMMLYQQTCTLALQRGRTRASGKKGGERRNRKHTDLLLSLVF